MKENIVLVDKNDNEVGFCEKIKVHKKGLLHRAFSIFIFNNDGELLMQKRAKNKYHSGGLWSNTACGHPKKDELTLNASHRRLFEEMGFDCELKKMFSFKYKTKFENSLIENEIDHVFIGRYNGEVNINKNEAEEHKWIKLSKLKSDIKKNPNCYTYWLKVLMNKYLYKIYIHIQ